MNAPEIISNNITVNAITEKADKPIMQVLKNTIQPEQLKIWKSSGSTCKYKNIFEGNSKYKFYIIGRDKLNSPQERLDSVTPKMGEGTSSPDL